TAPPCVTTRLIEDRLQDDGSVQDEWEVMAATAAAYTGRDFQTTATLNSAVIQLMQYPLVQDQVHQEIQAYLRGERLPELEDRDAFPYLEAVIREIMREANIYISPDLTLPRRACEVSEYRGMLIPKDTIVFMNTWAILRDENEYPDPHLFKPERFLESSQGKQVLRTNIRDPHDIFFGIGRRSCSGRQLASDSLWITLATLLTVFEIRRPEGVENSDESESGLIAYATSYNLGN
ncbi:cytochrome P450, partial [Sistotremastrum suecicum HHB10207 ss-3]